MTIFTNINQINSGGSDVDIEKIANTDLSNLTAVGETHFANKSLSNIDALGQAKFLNKQMITNCLISATSGLVTASGNTLTVPSGLIFLIPNGVDATTSMIKNIETATSIATTFTESSSQYGTRVLFYNSDNTLTSYLQSEIEYDNVLKYWKANGSKIVAKNLATYYWDGSDISSFIPEQVATIDMSENDDRFVHKTGDETISDIKTFIGISAQDPLEAHMIIKNLKDDFRYSDGTKFYYISFRDKNNKECGWMGYNHTDKSSFIELGARKTPKGTSVTILEVGFDDDGNEYTYAPKPTEDTTTSRQLDTVGARNTKLESYQEKETAVNYNNITNCITEIPQDIKLELNDGVLTLKAGSKVYVPNGDGVFDTVTIASDMTQSSFSTGVNTEHCLFYYNGVLRYFNKTQISSGSTAPSGDKYLVWYDTTNNVIKISSDGGSTWSSGVSLPLCRFTTTNNTITLIDQVFNGFGYIGSTVFALPGVKGLISDGRNEDGTLKSIYWTCNSVVTKTYSTTENNKHITLGFNGTKFSRLPGNNHSYNQSENYNYDIGSLWYYTVIGFYDINDGIISNFQPKAVFHTLDYNDTEFIGHQAMPSDRYIDWTLLASGQTYTAPADGLIFLSKTVGTANGKIEMHNTTTDLRVITPTGGLSTTSFAYSSIQVNKGDVVKIEYTITGVTNKFRFIYNNSSK